MIVTNVDTVMNTMLCPPRRQGIRLRAYLDDWLVLACSRHQCEIVTSAFTFAFPALAKIFMLPFSHYLDLDDYAGRYKKCWFSTGRTEGSTLILAVAGLKLTTDGLLTTLSSKLFQSTVVLGKKSYYIVVLAVSTPKHWLLYFLPS